jgi:hypothetical protein
MSKRIKLFGLALVAICALGASVLSLTASALPSVLPENTAERTWSGANVGSAKLEKSNGTSVTCTAASATGTEEVKKPLGLFHITFSTCTGPLGVTCTGLGDESGKILSLGSWHLVYDTLGATLGQAGVGILFLLGDVHFECLGVLILVFLGGMVLCLVTKPTTSNVTHEFKCTAAGAGLAKETTYYNGGGTLTKIVTLLSEEGSNGKPENSVEIAAGTVTYAVAVELMN